MGFNQKHHYGGSDRRNAFLHALRNAQIPLFALFQRLSSLLFACRTRNTADANGSSPPKAISSTSPASNPTHISATFFLAPSSSRCSTSKRSIRSTKNPPIRTGIFAAPPPSPAISFTRLARSCSRLAASSSSTPRSVASRSFRVNVPPCGRRSCCSAPGCSRTSCFTRIADIKGSNSTLHSHLHNHQQLVQGKAVSWILSDPRRSLRLSLDLDLNLNLDQDQDQDQDQGRE